MTPPFTIILCSIPIVCAALGFAWWQLSALLFLWLVIISLYQTFLWPRLLSPLRVVPGPPVGGLVWGQFKNILKVESGLLHREWVKQYGSTVRAVGPLGLERLVLVSPTALRKILITDPASFPRPEFLKAVLSTVGGTGLLNLSGEEHKCKRKFLNPVFSISALTQQTYLFHEPIHNLIALLKSKIKQEPNSLRDGAVIRVFDWMSKTSLDIISQSSFGYKCNSLIDPTNELAVAHDVLVTVLYGPTILILLGLNMIPGFPTFMQSEWMYKHRHWLRHIPLLSPMEKLIDSLRRFKNVSMEIMKAQQSGITQSATRHDTLSLLLQAGKKQLGEDYQTPPEELTEHILTILSAGRASTASGLTWTLWLLAKHPHVQEKLRAELLPIIREAPEPDFSTLKKMEYLEAVLMESLRVIPPIPMTIRKVGKSDYVDGVWVPKDTLLYIGIRVINTLKDFWGDDAEEFKPERWFNLPSTYDPNLSFQTFLSGPHHCIGKTMAVAEMKAILAHLLTTFSFEPAYEGQITHPISAVTMKPSDGMPLRLRILSPDL